MGSVFVVFISPQKTVVVVVKTIAEYGAFYLASLINLFMAVLGSQHPSELMNQVKNIGF